MLLNLLFLIANLAFVICIAYQDFKHRLISAWLVYGFVVTCAAGIYFTAGQFVLLSNLISSTLFLLLWFGVIFLYYFLKEKRLSNFIDSKLGWADILILFGIGLSMEIISFTLFISISALIALLFSLRLIRENKTIPLAGILAILFLVFEGVKIVAHQFASTKLFLPI